MTFWIKNLLLMLVLLGLTAYVLLSDDINFNSGNQGSGSTSSKRNVAQSVESQQQTDSGAFTTTNSSAASGLSKFYSQIRRDLLGTGDTLGDGFVIRVKPSIYTLDEQLQNRGAMVTPGSPQFTGRTTIRHFRKGKTIRNQLDIAAKDEGMALIWQLERDYIIKEYFRVNADFLKTLSSVAHALNSDFEKHVYALYCYNQRAVIITYDYTKYVKNNCRDASRENGQLPG